MDDLFRYDNSFLTTLCKIGDLFILSLLWLLYCIPVITIIPASSALYYVVVKTVRRERGSTVKQFWLSFRKNLASGLKVSLVFIPFAVVTALWFWFSACFPLNSMQGIIYTTISRILLVAFAFGTAFLVPLFARFYMKTISYWKYSFFLGFRHLGWSLLVLAGTIVTVTLIILLPPLVAILPSVLALGSSFVIEPILARYTMVSSEEEKRDIWYDHNAS